MAEQEKIRRLQRPRNAAQYSKNMTTGSSDCARALAGSKKSIGHPANASTSQYRLGRDDPAQSTRKTSASRNPTRKNCKYAKIDKEAAPFAGKNRDCIVRIARMDATKDR